MNETKQGPNGETIDLDGHCEVDVRTVTLLDVDVMRLAVEAIECDRPLTARRILEDRIAWYAEVGAAARASRRQRPSAR